MFDDSDSSDDESLAGLISKTPTKCPHCSLSFPLSELKPHIVQKHLKRPEVPAKKRKPKPKFGSQRQRHNSGVRQIPSASKYDFKNKTYKHMPRGSKPSSVGRANVRPEQKPVFAKPKPQIPKPKPKPQARDEIFAAIRNRAAKAAEQKEEKPSYLKPKPFNADNLGSRKRPIPLIEDREVKRRRYNDFEYGERSRLAKGEAERRLMEKLAKERQNAELERRARERAQRNIAEQARLNRIRAEEAARKFKHRPVPPPARTFPNAYARPQAQPEPQRYGNNRFFNRNQNIPLYNRKQMNLEDQRRRIQAMNGNLERTSMGSSSTSTLGGPSPGNYCGMEFSAKDVKGVVNNLVSMFAFERPKIIEAIHKLRTINLNVLSNFLFETKGRATSSGGPTSDANVDANQYVSGDYGRFEERRPSGGFGNDYEAAERIESVIMDDVDVAAQVLGGLKNIEDMKEMETPEGMIKEPALKNYQKQGLHWLVNKEKDKKWKGGMLCDDMGVGKTVQMIALMCANRCPVDNPRPNLIVCPVSLTSQWKDEIRFWSKRTFRKIIIYHGPKRPKKISELQKADIIITTYGLVGNECLQKKRSDDDDDFLEKPEGPLHRVKYWRIILDEAHGIKNRSTKSAKGCFALIAERRWCLTGTPIQNKMDDLYSYFKFLRLEPFNKWAYFRSLVSDIQDKQKHGVRRENAWLKIQALLKSILLRRTKKMVLKDLPKKTIRLDSLEFTKQEREFYNNIETVMKNKFEKLLAEGLVQRNYMNVLHMLLRMRQACDHPYLILSKKHGDFKKSGISDDEDDDDVQEEKPMLQKRITIPPRLDRDKVLQLEEMGFGRIRICNAYLKLGPSSDVNQVIQHLFDNWSNKDLDKALPDQNNFTGLKVLSKLEPKARERIEREIGTGKDLACQECPVCLDVLEDGVLTLCGHVFCHECLNEIPQKVCPSCRAKVRIADAIPLEQIKKGESHREEVEMEIKNIPFNDREAKKQGWAPSTKLRMLLQTLKDIRTKTNGREKTIVFSQFTSMLDLCEIPLLKNGFEYVRYDGKLSINQRDCVLKKFKTSHTHTVMLMSLKCGNLGLNMTQANHIVFLDLWWNPAVEEQAMDRVHRIGQKKEVEVHRLTVKNTVEQRILKMQDEKRDLAKNALATGKVNVNRLSLNDLKELFGVN